MASRSRTVAPAVVDEATEEVTTASTVELQSLFAAVDALSKASAQQAAAMYELSRATAESVRLAAGSYVFQLRDRFDEMLPACNLGASDAQWFVNESPGPIDQLVFHSGDDVNIELRLALSQSPIRRVVNVTWTDVPTSCDVNVDPRFSSASGMTRSDLRYQLDSDTSLFIDLSLTLHIGDHPTGPLHETAVVVVECTDTRPEGAVALLTVEIPIRGIVVPDDDGVGVDIPTVEAIVREERRTYWLDKAERLPLQLPKL